MVDKQVENRKMLESSDFLTVENNEGLILGCSDSFSIKQLHTRFLFRDENGKLMLEITDERQITVAEDIYEAAKIFWETVRQLAPEGWNIKCKESVNDGKQ